MRDVAPDRVAPAAARLEAFGRHAPLLGGDEIEERVALDVDETVLLEEPLDFLL